MTDDPCHHQADCVAAAAAAVPSEISLAGLRRPLGDVGQQHAPDHKLALIALNWPEIWKERS